MATNREERRAQQDLSAYLLDGLEGASKTRMMQSRRKTQGMIEGDGFREGLTAS